MTPPEKSRTPSPKESVVILLLLLILLLYESLVLSWMWKWFVTPLGLVEINPRHALGLVLTVSLIRYRIDQETPTPTLAQIRHVFLVITWFLFLSWLLSFGVPQ